MVMNARKLLKLDNGCLESKHQEHLHQNLRHSSKSHSSRYDNYDDSRSSPNGSRYEHDDGYSPTRNRSYPSKSSYSQKMYEKERERHERNNRYERDRDRRYDREREKDRDRYDKNRDSKYDRDRDRPRSSRDSRTADYNHSPKERRPSSRDYKEPDHTGMNDKGSVNERFPRVNCKVTGTPPVSSSSTSTSSSSTPAVTSSPPPLPPVQPVPPPSHPSTTSTTGTTTIHNSSLSSCLTTSIGDTPAAHTRVLNSMHKNSVTTPNKPSSMNCNVNSINHHLGSNLRPSTGTVRKPEHIKEVVENNRLTRYGDWTEHMSSIGRMYYYHIRTEVSQWEKPPGWVEREEALGLPISQPLPPPQPLQSASNASSPASSASSTSIKCKTQDKHSSHSSHSGSISNNREHNDNSVPIKNDGIQKPRDGSSLGEVLSQDMELCSGSSTPMSETCVPQNSVANLLDISLPPNSPPPIPAHLPHGTSSSEPSEVSKNSVIRDKDDSFAVCDNRRSLRKLETDHNNTDKRSPTPTHSENEDSANNRKNIAINGGAVSSLQNVANSCANSQATQGLTPVPVVQLTPSLSRFVRDDLTAHIRNWPAEALEKQANKVREERVVLTNMQLARISTEATWFRSHVRANEIRCTLGEQRLLLLKERARQILNGDTAFTTLTVSTFIPKEPPPSVPAVSTATEEEEEVNR